ncbi:MAG: hypothetical protein QM504_09275 [Pseudomonadota bacterium]
MIKYKYHHLHIALLLGLLLFGQYGVLIHSVQHPFHIADPSCEIFFALEQSTDGVLFDSVQLFIASTFIPIIAFFKNIFSLTQTSYHSRAPPILS